MLSGQETFERYYNVKLSPNILGHGLKQRRRHKTNEENEMVELYQDNLRRLLSADRISRTSERSTAHILENGQIQLDKKIGKLPPFGQKNYLKPYEALYLMQINRLEIYQNGVIVSLEKAYHSLLSDSKSNNRENLTKEEFLVYSHLMRCGHHINDIHADLRANKEQLPENVAMNKGQMTKMCVWKYLDELLHSRKATVPADCNTDDYYGNIKRSMNNIAEGIKCQNTAKSPASGEASTSITAEIGKVPNKSSFGSPIIPKLSFGRVRLNDFMIGEEFHLFQEVFDKLDMFPIMSSQLNCTDLVRMPRSTFSLSLPANNSSDGETRPNNCKVIVLRANGVPAIQNVYNLITDELRDSSVIFVFVSKEFSSYSFVYRF